MSSLSAGLVQISNGSDVIINGTTGSGVASLQASNVTVSGTISASHVNVNYLSVGDSIDVSGNITVGGNVTVQGTVYVDRDLGVDGNIYVDGSGSSVYNLDVTNNVSSNSIVATNLTVNNTITYNTLEVTGSMVIDSSANIGGNLGVGGNLTVAGDLQTTGDELVLGDLTVNGVLNSTSGFSVDVSGNVSIPAQLNVTGSANLGSSLYVTNGLAVNENVSIEQNQSVLQNEYVGNDLFVGNELQMDASGTIVTLNSTQLESLVQISESIQFNYGLQGLNMWPAQYPFNTGAFAGIVQFDKLMTVDLDGSISSTNLAKFQPKATWTKEEITNVYPSMYHTYATPDTIHNSIQVAATGTTTAINEQLRAVQVSGPQLNANNVYFNYNGFDEVGFDSSGLEFTFSPLQKFRYIDSSLNSFQVEVAEYNPSLDIRNRCQYSIFVPSTTTTYNVHVSDVSGGASVTVTPFAEKVDVKLFKDRLAQYGQLSTVTGKYGMYSLLDTSNWDFTDVSGTTIEADINKVVAASVDASGNSIRNTKIDYTDQYGQVWNFKQITYMDTDLTGLQTINVPGIGNFFGVYTRNLPVGSNIVPVDSSGAVYINGIFNFRYRDREYTRVCHGSKINYLDADFNVINEVPLLDNQFYNSPSSIPSLPATFDGNNIFGAPFEIVEHYPQQSNISTVVLQLDLSGGLPIPTTDASGNAGYKISMYPESDTKIYQHNQTYEGTPFQQKTEFGYCMPFSGHYDKFLDTTKTNLVYVPSTNEDVNPGGHITGDIFYVVPRLLNIPDKTNPDFYDTSGDGYPIVYVGTNLTLTFVPDLTIGFGVINYNHILSRDGVTGKYYDTSGALINNTSTGLATGQTLKITQFNVYTVTPSKNLVLTKDNNITIQIKSNNLLDGIIYNASVQFTPFVANPNWLVSNYLSSTDLSGHTSIKDVSGNYLLVSPFQMTFAYWDISCPFLPGSVSGRTYFQPIFNRGDLGPSIHPAYLSLPNAKDPETGAPKNNKTIISYQHNYACTPYVNSYQERAKQGINAGIQSTFYEKETAAFTSPWNSFGFTLQPIFGVSDGSNCTFDRISETGLSNTVFQRINNFKVTSTGFATHEVPVKMVSKANDGRFLLENLVFLTTAGSITNTAGIYNDQVTVIDSAGVKTPFMDYICGPQGIFFEPAYWTIDSSGIYRANRPAILADFGYTPFQNTVSMFNVFYGIYGSGQYYSARFGTLLPGVTKPTTWPSEFRKQLILANRPKKNKIHTQFLFQNSANISC